MLLICASPEDRGCNRFRTVFYPTSMACQRRMNQGTRKLVTVRKCRGLQRPRPGVLGICNSGEGMVRKARSDRSIAPQPVIIHIHSGVRHLPRTLSYDFTCPSFSVILYSCRSYYWAEDPRQRPSAQTGNDDARLRIRLRLQGT